MSGAPDVLQRLGRPGFPKGMVVLLVGGAEHERIKIERQMNKLGYQGETAAHSLSRCSQPDRGRLLRGLCLICLGGFLLLRMSFIYWIRRQLERML